MRMPNWKNVAEIVGIMAIVASLAYVGMEMQQARRIALGEAANQTLTNVTANNNALIDHMGIWIKGNSDGDLDPSERRIFRILVENASNQSFFEMRQAGRIGSDLLNPIHAFSAFLYQNPGARRSWITYRERLKKYRDPLLSDDVQISEVSLFVETVHSDLEKLDQTYD